jgi:ADP-ribose pyrophosphatase YjhB (NUDIX family)
VVVGTFVLWQDHLLMCQRALEPARGLWTIPAGFLECGETLAQGAARETGEETGLWLDPQRLELSCIVNLPAIAQVFVCFRTELQARPDLAPGPESLAASFMVESEFQAAEVAWRDTMGDAPTRILKEIRDGHFSIRLVDMASDPVTFTIHEYRIQSRTILATAGSSG